MSSGSPKNFIYVGAIEIPVIHINSSVAKISGRSISLVLFLVNFINIPVERIDVILARQRVSVLTLLSMGKETGLDGWLAE